jgi:hypothetical protein
MRTKLGVMGLLGAVMAAWLLTSPTADAAPQKKKKATASQSQVVASTRSRTRVRVQNRSFLDIGTEVLPGERKFTDYAIPPGYSPTAVIDNTAFSHRSPLLGAFDLPGRNNPYPWGW